MATTGDDHLESVPLQIGIVVVAYNAASTLEAVLDRIPQEFRPRIARVYVCDDHSQDSTYQIGLDYRAVVADLDVHVVRWPRNLGYGGNQKASYQMAIDDGMDVVVLLHGDGQYAPEVMHELVAPILDGDADAVMGSRMLDQGAARRGGMPMYKYVGNRVLTTFENAVLGTNLSEFHSGYRAYRTDVLSLIRFDDLSDDFDFDTEIIIRLVDHERSIVEVPIPTYYGDEICRVDGLKYARQVSTDVVTWRLNKLGLGRGRLASAGEEYDLKPEPWSSHGRLLEWLTGSSPLEVLDLGCAGGEFAAQVAELGHRVTGVDAVDSKQARARCDEFLHADLDEGVPVELRSGTFDVVVLADVLEHTRNPKQVLDEAVECLAPDGKLLISVPNFAHWYPRARVALGMFDYDQRGILDETHLRFFTRRSFLQLLDSVGLQVNVTSTSASPVGSALGSGRLGSTIRHATLRIRPTLFAYQFLVQAAPIAPAYPGPRGLPDS